DVDDEAFNLPQFLAGGVVDFHARELDALVLVLEILGIDIAQPRQRMIHWMFLPRSDEQKLRPPGYDRRMTSPAETAPAPQLRERADIPDRFKWRLADIFAD